MSLELTNHPLVRADGSATFSSNLFTVLAAVNGPVEVQRRDELPEEAAIEVNIRPSSGIGGPRERWMETVIASLLRSLLLAHMHPRTLMQVTLQVTKEPSLKLKRAVLDVAIIPALANAAFSAVVDAALPLQATMVAALGCFSQEGQTVLGPSEKELVGCKSVHAMAYALDGVLLLDESVGGFDVEEWEQIAEALKQKALAAMANGNEDQFMSNGVDTGAPWLRQNMEESVRKAGAWREGG